MDSQAVYSTNLPSSNYSQSSSSLSEEDSDDSFSMLVTSEARQEFDDYQNEMTEVDNNDNIAFEMFLFWNNYRSFL